MIPPQITTIEKKNQRDCFNFGIILLVKVIL